MKHITQTYAERVVAGEVLTCRWEFLACSRHLTDLRRIGDADFPYMFDESRADRIYRWYGFCRHVRGPFSGLPIDLRDWQKFDHGVEFGWVHKDTGKRRFRKGLHLRSRGNVKSTENSAKCLFFMNADAIYPPGRPDLARFESMPEVHCLGVDREQAGRVWGDARAMAEGSPDIIKRMRVRRTYIEHDKRGGKLRKLSGEKKNKEGGAPCYVSIDDYQEHPDSELHDRELDSFGKRDQSLMDIICTAGDSAENNPGKMEWEIGCKILSGDIKADDYFVMIRQLDPDDNPHDEALWGKANPILRDKNPYSEELFRVIKSEHDLAYDSGDAHKIFRFLTRRCCLWQASAENKYLSAAQMDKLKALQIPRSEFRRLVKDHPAYVGLDMSKSIDLTATAHVFRLQSGEHGKAKYAITAHGFIPEQRVLEHEKSDRITYRAWGEKGCCTLTSGSVTDPPRVEASILDLEIGEGWKIAEICFDAANSGLYIGQSLEGKGYTSVEVRQIYLSLSPATKRLREMILSGEIVVEENELFIWCCSNAIEKTDGKENIQLSKKHKDDTQRIDLLAAVINALTRALVIEESEPYFGVAISS